MLVRTRRLGLRVGPGEPDDTSGPERGRFQAGRALARDRGAGRGRFQAGRASASDRGELPAGGGSGSDRGCLERSDSGANRSGLPSGGSARDSLADIDAPVGDRSSGHARDATIEGPRRPASAVVPDPSGPEPVRSSERWRSAAVSPTSGGRHPLACAAPEGSPLDDSGSAVGRSGSGSRGGASLAGAALVSLGFVPTRSMPGEVVAPESGRASPEVPAESGPGRIVRSSYHQSPSLPL